MPIPEIPINGDYECLPFDEVQDRYFYGRGGFLFPSQVNSGTQPQSQLLGLIDAFEASTGNTGFLDPIAISDFCAAIPYTDLTCRTEAGQLICETQALNLTVTEPFIVSPRSSVTSGKVRGGTVLFLEANQPATAIVECNVNGRWVGGASDVIATANGLGGTSFYIEVHSCLSDQITDCRIKICNECCVDGATPNTVTPDCQTKPFTIEPCTMPSELGLSNSGWMIPSLNPSNGYADSDTISVGQALFSSIGQVYLAIPKDYLCGSLNLNDFTGCATIPRSSFSLFEVGLSDVQATLGSQWGNDVSATGAVTFYYFAVNGIVPNDCTLTYEGQTVCGAPFTITIPLTP